MPPLSRPLWPLSSPLIHLRRRPTARARGDDRPVATCAYNVYRTYHRLIGAPPRTPPLHVRVHAVPLRHLAREGEEEKEDAVATSYDIVPCDATDLHTLARLLGGQCVHAETRVRAVPWPLRRADVALAVFCGRAVGDQMAVRAWVRAYTGCGCVDVAATTDERRGEAGLSLYRRNCWHFARDVERHMLEMGQMEI